MIARKENILGYQNRCMILLVLSWKLGCLVNWGFLAETWNHRVRPRIRLFSTGLSFCCVLLGFLSVLVANAVILLKQTCIQWNNFLNTAVGNKKATVANSNEWSELCSRSQATQFVCGHSSEAINDLQSLVVSGIPYSGAFKLADTLGITSLTAYFLDEGPDIGKN